MTEVTALESLSASRFDKGVKCWYAFFQDYVLDIRSPPSGALAFGRADDKTKNYVYDEKILTGETAGVSVCQEKFAAEFEESAGDVDEWEDDKDKMKDTGVALIGHWRDKTAVDTKPVATQLKFDDPVDYKTAEGEKKTFRFNGYLDLVEEDPEVIGSFGLPVSDPDGHTGRVITDNKTSKKRWSKSRVAESTQAVAYGLAAERSEDLIALHVDPNQAHFHVAVKTNSPQMQTPATDPAMVRRTDAAERQGFLRRMALFHQTVEANIKSGSWLPNRSHFLCSKRWCPHWAACEKEFGGTVKD